MNNIILDTDPGIDDAVAIAVLMKHAGDRVKLILAGYGNIGADKAVRNASLMMNLLEIEDIPIVKASEKPKNGGWEEAQHIHGGDGIGGVSADYPSGYQNVITGDFPEIAYQKIKESGKVDYITLGPLTNLAKLIERYPDVVDSIETVVTMGGGIGKGNIRPFAEFNIFSDPYSAEYVFERAKKLCLVPLNTTLTVSLDMEQIDSVEEKTPLDSAMKKILTANYHNCVKYGEPGSTMHDSTAVLYLLCPELFKTVSCGIEVDLGERLGETKITPKRNNVLLTTECQSEILIEKILQSI